MSDAATRVSIAASGQSQQLDGDVCISAINCIATLCLQPVIQKLRERYPGINIEVLASDQLSNLGQREADIAIRNVQPTHPDLVAKKICNVSARLYGSKEYLNTLGRPINVTRLNNAAFTGFNRADESIDTFSHIGLTLTRDNFPVVSENHLVQWELVKSGIALGVMIEVVGDKESMVERVLPDSEVLDFPVWLVAHKQLKSSKRIRAVFDLLSNSLAESLKGH